MRAVTDQARAALTGAVLTCITLSGCSFSAHTASGPPVVSKADLQKDIAQRLTAAGQPPRSVSCADDLVGEVSRSTRCEVVLADDNAIEPIVTATGVDGTTVNYEMTPALSREQLQKEVASQMAENATPVDTVTCAGGLDGVRGDEAHCTVEGGGQTTETVVQVTRVDGLMMNFRINPD